MKKIKDDKILLIISSIMDIIAIFFGPFLISYFIKTTPENIQIIGLYNMLLYLSLGIFYMLNSYIAKKHSKLSMLRCGIILNFVYIFIFYVLKNKVINFIIPLSIFYGFAKACYYVPYNLLSSQKVEDNNRTTYEITKKGINLLLNIIIPIVLGFSITTIEFEQTLTIILILSLIQVLLSFTMKKLPKTRKPFSPLLFFKQFRKKAEFNNQLLLAFLNGITVSNAVLGTLLTIFVFNQFKTDLNLGFITAAASIFSFIGYFIFQKYTKNKNYIGILVSVVNIMCLILFLYFNNDITLIIYQIIYTICMNILVLLTTIKLYDYASNISKNTNYRLEFLSFRELILDLGRVVGFLLLFLLGLFNKLYMLEILMIILTFMTLVLGIILYQIKK